MNKRRIITTALIGTIALVGLSVTLTLAWYAASDRLSLRSLNVDVATVAELKVSKSADPDSFVSEIDLTPENKDFVFSPVSSMNKKSWMEQKSDTPLFYDCSSPLVPSSGEPYNEVATYGFFQQKLYLMSTLDYYVTLDVDPLSENHSIFEYDDAENLARAEQLKDKHPEWNMEVSEIKDKLDNLLNSLRVSILVTDENHYNYYIIDPTKDTTKTDGDITVFGGLLDNDNDGYFDTYYNHSNEAFEVVYGEIVNNDRDNIVYKDPQPASSNPQPASSEGSEEQQSSVPNNQFFVNSFEGKSKETAHTFDLDASKKKAQDKGIDLFAKEESYSLNEINSDSTSLRIPCFSNKSTEIVVSIYLEGWDRDCINSTMGASFNTKLSFKLLRGIIE